MRLFKRNKTWYVEFERGVKRSLKTSSEKIANNLFAEIEKEFLAGRILQLDKSGTTTLSEFRAIFFDLKDFKSDKTVENYRNAIDLFIDSAGENTLVSRISNKAISAFKKSCRARGVKLVSIDSYLRHVRHFLKTAVKNKYLETMPDIEFYNAHGLPRIIYQSERLEILKYTRRNDYEWYRIVLFCLWTAARREEVANLKYQDIFKDFDGDWVVKLTGKGKKTRTVPLMPMALHAIGDMKDIGYVFQHWADLGKYTKGFKEIVKKLDLDKTLHFHCLRHTSATMMLEAGVNLKAVQKILGHKYLSTTEIYMHVLDGFVKKELCKLRPNRTQSRVTR